MMMVAATFPLFYKDLCPCQSNCIGHVNRMDSKRKVSQVLIIPREIDKDDDQKTDSETVYQQILIDAKLKTGKRGKKNLTGRSPLTF